MVNIKKSVWRLAIMLLAVWMSNNTYSADAYTAQYYADKGLKSAKHFPGLASLCDISQEPRNMFVISENRRERSKRSNGDSEVKGNAKVRRQIPPQQVFDNLYYVGAGNVASWAIDTGESIVLVDALNNNQQAQHYILNGLSALGLGDKPISHLIISHGHGDHYGGFGLIKSVYSPRIVMSEIEWHVLENDAFASYRWGAKPEKDLLIEDGDVLNVNGTELAFYVTPGHTPGTLTIVLPVIDGDERHRAVLWGGTGLNYGPDVARIKSYTNSANAMKALVKEQNIDVFLSNHPGRDGTRDKLKALTNRKDNQAHPFIQGEDVVVEAFELLENCTRAQWMQIEENRAQ
ncbi:metallo-beta-lactamase class B [Alteromonas macleodii]|uniref:MBL fold metallo-hydrolase n=2 Tax=Alteromonas TaxID=226 RepID=UPI001283ADA3|nr:MBL fold metallo-hydrolase [Alteromonas macleodii]CAI3962905.1 metallo-beta-lactamase class B [Alteromonas macleodii]VTP56305.1 metallo-beta-lactamase class B [Alteromonas macleodii]